MKKSVKKKKTKDALKILVQSGIKKFGPDFPRLVQAEYTRLRNESGIADWDTSISNNGIVPDIKLDVVVDSIGYQVDIIVDGKHLGTECRDLSTDMRKEPARKKVVEDLLKRLLNTVEAWRKKN